MYGGGQAEGPELAESSYYSRQNQAIRNDGSTLQTGRSRRFAAERPECARELPFRCYI